MSNLEEVSSLKLCTQLRELTLAGNPVCRISGFTRRVCIDLLVQLTVLDDVEVEGDRETCSMSGCVWQRRKPSCAIQKFKLCGRVQ